MSKSSRPFCSGGEVIEISERATSPCDMRDLRSPLRRVKSHTWRIVIDFAALHQKKKKKVPPLRDERAMLPKLRFKEAKSAFMGNYANLCCEIGVVKKKEEKKNPFT